MSLEQGAYKLGLKHTSHLRLHFLCVGCIYIYYLYALHSHYGYSSKLHFPESTSYSAIVFVDNYILHNFVVTIIFCNWCVINWLSVACLFKTAQFILNECCRFTQYHGIEYLYIVWQYLKSNAPTVTVFWYGGLEGLGSFQKIRQNKQILVLDISELYVSSIGREKNSRNQLRYAT